MIKMDLEYNEKRRLDNKSEFYHKQVHASIKLRMQLNW